VLATDADADVAFADQLVVSGVMALAGEDRSTIDRVVNSVTAPLAIVD
jgi:hypothetical protein